MSEQKQRPASSGMLEILPPECLSEYRLDRHLLGVESESERQQTLAHTSQCSSCRATLTAMRQEQEAFLQVQTTLPAALLQAIEATQAEAGVATEAIPSAASQRPPDASSTSQGEPAIGVPQGASTDRPGASQGAPVGEAAGAGGVWGWLSLNASWLRQWGATVAVATACLGALVWFPQLWPGSGPGSDAGSPDYIGFKGPSQPRLLVALRRDGKIRLAQVGEAFRHRDQLRLAYQWSRKGPAYLYVFHRAVQPSTPLTPLYPNHPKAMSIPIKTGAQERDLPGSLEVDDARHEREEIWACFSTQAISHKAARSAIPPPSESQLWQTAPRGPCAYLARFYFTRATP